VKKDKNDFMNGCSQNHDSRTTQGAEPSVRTSGIVLLMTMVVLLVLVTLGYTLASRVASQRHRDSYIVDYTNACYARDSALKYALAALEDINDIKLISRPNEPDFSDLFHLSEQEYSQLVEQWAVELAKKQADSEGLDKGGSTATSLEANDSNGKYTADSNIAEVNDINNLKIRGPYGPSWPFVTEPVEFDIGSTHIKIETEDENAKYPAGWAIIDNEKVQRESQAGMQTFFEWMGYDSDRIKTVGDQLKQIASIKPFKVEFKPVVQRAAVTTGAQNPAGRSARANRTAYKTTAVSPTDSMVIQTGDFSKLFHSSLLDLQILAEPTITSETRKESALKYMGLWGTTQVNINSAPRNVLEAAFTFGGDAQQITDEIIKNRREKPFENIEELKKELFKFSDSIDKCNPYITTSSNTFSIHVTAVNGAAKVSAIVVVMKNGGKIQKVAVFSG
jgi:hypothetical protein